MKVKLLKTGEVAEYNDSYGARLIEQGQAVIAKAGPFMAEPVEPEEPGGPAPAVETRQKRTRKGE